MVKVVSFDMDGTLIQKDYVEHVWLEAIPELYAKKNGMDVEDAKEYVMNEYLKVGEAAIEWYDIKYWLKKFEIDCDWRELLESHAHMLKLYPEVNEVLENLRGKHELIITSNAAHEFIEVESRVLGLDKNSNTYSQQSQTLAIQKRALTYIRKYAIFWELKMRT